ncbi:MAG: molybdopterin-dependent oxidoreductase [Clostridia bacterium]|jgi:DMSO/TMAO reductase YedYZ molybdopterin-dependent catalytic subunit
MRKIVCIFLAFILLISITSGCTIGTQQNTDKLISLAKTEVKQYKGKNLSSILDFRENSIKGPQTVDIKKYSLKIDGLVGKPLGLTYGQVLKNTKYTKVVTLDCVEGWKVDILWEGILLKDLFKNAEVISNANTVIFHSVDGYTTSLPLKFVLDNNIMIAYKMNNVVLPPERGFPFQLVAESKLGYKWAKWIVRIELSDNSNYQGYWEQRGYSNEADVNN